MIFNGTLSSFSGEDALYDISDSSDQSEILSFDEFKLKWSHHSVEHILQNRGGYRADHRRRADFPVGQYLYLASRPHDGLDSLIKLTTLFDHLKCSHISFLPPSPHLFKAPPFPPNTHSCFRNKCCVFLFLLLPQPPSPLLLLLSNGSGICGSVF